ncbi:MAG: hypothetical protein LQ346_007870 [Caloplaca aetnensis]|nr:MAG: hypothetical protein LQ346_007870 [Caloplaca aetnensis]
MAVFAPTVKYGRVYPKVNLFALTVLILQIRCRDFMAGWEVRGYVQDSEEEEERLSDKSGSQKGTSLDTRLAEDFENAQVKAHQEVKDNIGAEEHHSTVVAAAGEDERSTAHGETAGKSFGTVWDLPTSSHEIDELQEGHYRPQPNARSDLTSADRKLARGLSQQDISPTQLPISSPLTTPSSSPAWRLLLPNSQSDSCVRKHDVPLHGHEVQTRYEPTVQEQPTISTSLAGTTCQRTRALRHRNPIQLHPYAIESEKYRQTLKSSGVKPLRIAQVESQEARALEAETQKQDYLAGVSSQDDLPPSDSPLSRSPTIAFGESPNSRSRPLFKELDLDDAGAELPDLEALLRRMPPKVAFNGRKRRRVMASVGETPQQDLSIAGPHRPRFRRPPTFGNDCEETFVVPPSPPQSQTPRSSSTSRPISRGFRVPRRLSPVALPTPVTSSEPRRRARMVSEASQPEALASASESGNGETEASASETQEVNHRQLERAQRKIRGVLPASWLKLDLRSQVKKPSERHKRHETRSPEREAVAQRGVARPLLLRKRDSMSSHSAIQLVDSSSESGGENERTHPCQSPSLDSPLSRSPAIFIHSDDDDLSLPGDLWGEVAEDNRIDAMLPPVGRGKGFRKPPQLPKHRKRQTRLTDTPKGKTNAQRLANGHHSRKKHQQDMSQGFPRPRKPKFRPPDLSLLDVSSVGVSSTGHAPAFIRLAQRTSRSRRDQGKSKPNCKYLRMTTEVETEDVNEYLRFWREGTLKPLARPRALGAAASPRGTRSPLRSCSGNHRAVQDSTLVPGKGPAFPARHEKKMRPRSRMANSPKARSIQTTLSNIIHLSRNDHELQHAKEPKRDSKLSGKGRHLKRLSRSGQVVSSFQASAHSRPAMLESLQASIGHDRSRSNLHHRLDMASADAAAPNPLLAKFLDDTGPSYTTMHPPDGVPKDGTAIMPTVANLRKRQPRKRRPHRLSIQTPRSHHAIDPLGTDHDDLHSIAHIERLVGDCKALIGLAPSNTPYTISFDVVCLLTGTCFGERTFIGSGELGKSFIKGDLDQARGFLVFDHDSISFRWGPWDDSVSTSMGKMIDEAYEALEQPSRHNHLTFQLRLEGTIELMRQLIRYLSRYLRFHDTIDRIAFLQRCKNLMLPLFQLLLVDRSEEAHARAQITQSLRMRATSLSTVLLAQLLQISKHAIVPQAMQTDLRSCLQDLVGKALRLALDDDSAGIAQCIGRLKHSRGSSVVLDDDNDASVELLVIACHVAEENASLSGFWRAMQPSLLPPSAEARLNVRVLEVCWERLHFVLPFLAFDQQGVLDADRRQSISTENWAVVKSLLEPVFETYDGRRHTKTPTINNYCRALFGRCFQLINVWGWRRCESVIGVLFDFFARRSLSHLPNEESRGSPSFLSQLSQKPRLKVEPEDRCFHVLLKIIGTGLQQMQEVYPSKKIRDIVWRLMPNHGRFLPKDQAIQRTDLDALRNHHDLLCTLYWASPSGFRPRPTVIRDLVDVENSHKEACRINIRAWSNLITFQLAAVDESLTSLKAFVDWWNRLLEQIVRQHQNARIEAEEHAGLAESREGVRVNRSLLDATVAQNQRHVEAMLSEVLLSMGNAISIARDLEAATLLLSPDLASIFNLFSVRSSHTNQVVIHALEVLSTYANKAIPSAQTVMTAEKDDSQDYGDWSAFEPDAVAGSLNSAVAQHLEGCFQAPLRQLLSNCFGADTSPEDAILTNMVDTWVAVGRTLVQEGRRNWTDYIGGYGPDSWAALRDTEQTRRFTAYYMAVLVESDGKVFEEHRQAVLKAWAASVVERELVLKYQHRLTSSLLNVGADKSFLANPPFWSVHGHFQISSSEFSERRLALISNVLSNMRKSVEHGRLETSSGAANLRAEYKEILRVLMSSMKSNYQQLGQGLDIRGAYVDFVHKIVELLQQHTTSICPIDRFFTDSSSFALPATDPTYVVGQLKNYGMRLHDHRTPKQLAVFIQSVSERAALDGHQMYLVDQLFLAMKTNTQQEGREDLGLRLFLIIVIFPTYIGLAFNTACGWILALPILQTLISVFLAILVDINGVNDVCVESTSTMVLAVLSNLQKSIEPLVDDPDTTKQPKILKMLTACFAAITAVLPALDYLCLLSPKKIHHARALMHFFRSFGLFAARHLLGESDIKAPDNMDEHEHTSRPLITHQHADVQAFALQELRETLTKHWICHDEHYYVNRGMSRRRVTVDLGFYEEEKAGFLGAVEGFWNALERMTVLRLE